MRSSSQTVSPAAHASAEKGITELRDALGSDAYWKAPTWKRLVAIGAGPAANIALDDRPLHVPVHDRRGAGDANGRDGGTGAPGKASQSPAQSVGLQAGDRIVAIDGSP